MTAQVTIYRDPANVTVTVIDGDPPIDLAAQVASLTTQLAAANAKIAVARTAAQAAKDADAAKVDGQDILDALA